MQRGCFYKLAVFRRGRSGSRLARSIGRRAAAFGLAVVILTASDQAGSVHLLHFPLDQSTFDGPQPSLVVALGYLNAAQNGGLAQSTGHKLGLDGARVDPPSVQVGTDLGSNVHVLFGLSGRAVDQNMDRGDDLALAELPHVKLVEVKHAVDIHDRVTHGFERDGSGNTLEQNVRGRLAERQGRVEDDDGDEERDGRVRVESPPGVRVQDEETGGNDTDVAESVAENVEEDTLHVHAAVRVTAAVRVAVTGSIVRIRTAGVVVSGVRIVIVRMTVLVCGRRGGGSFKISVGAGGAVVLGTVGQQAGSLVVGAKRSDRV